MVRVFKIIAFLFVIQLVVARPVYAYLDPGTGSYIFQLLIASLLGIMFTVKTFWKTIKTFLIRFFHKKHTI